MNNLTLEKTVWKEITKTVKEYFNEIGNKNDGFFSDMLFEGTPYIIFINGQLSGFFSVGNAWENGNMLRAFYIKHSMKKYSNEILLYVIENFSISAALIASNDEHFMCLAFETMNKLKTSFDMQAFNFVYGAPQKDAEYDLTCMHKILPQDYDMMNKLTDAMWDGCFENNQNEFYSIKSENNILGFGSIIPVKYNDKAVDIGNFVLPQYRQKGVGRSIIINLAEIAKKQGKIPVAGCWYGNKESIATLQSGGFIPQSRLFYVKFK